MYSQVAVDSDLTWADRVTWVDGRQLKCGSILKVSNKVKHFHFGAKQRVFQDTILALDCIGQRNEAACEDGLWRNIILSLHVNLVEYKPSSS